MTNKIKTTNKEIKLFIILIFLTSIIFVLSASKVVNGGDEDETSISGDSLTIVHDTGTDMGDTTTSTGYTDDDGYIHKITVVTSGESAASFDMVVGKEEEPEETPQLGEPSPTTTKKKEKKDKDKPDSTTPSTCFLAGTPVALLDGTEKPIEDIEVGDIVLSYDEKTQTNVASKVEETSHHPKEQTNSYLIINNKLRVTPNHPVFVNNKWQRIDNAKIGNVLRLWNGNNLIITSIRLVYDNVQAYNLRIENTHTYYVWDVLVHNGCGTTGKEVPSDPIPDSTPDSTPDTTSSYSPPPDPCAGVNCGSCRYCSGGGCYNYCSGSDTRCGCTSCTNCNNQDTCNGPYYDNYVCSNRNCVVGSHELDTECAGLAADITAVSNFYNKGVPVVLLNISNPYSLATGELILHVHDEDGAPAGSCSQVISLTDTKLFYGASVKDAHFYPWAESMLNCNHHSCSEETHYNYKEKEFYEKYPGLLILENTPSYLPGSGFAGTALPNCESLFKSLGVGFYDLTASLEVIP